MACFQGILDCEVWMSRGEFVPDHKTSIRKGSLADSLRFALTELTRRKTIDMSSAKASQPNLESEL